MGRSKKVYRPFSPALPVRNGTADERGILERDLRAHWFERNVRDFLRLLRRHFLGDRTDDRMERDSARQRYPDLYFFKHERHRHPTHSRALPVLREFQWPRFVLRTRLHEAECAPL